MSVDLTIEGPVAKITLTRPEKLNALTQEMRAQLRDYSQQLRYDENVRCIVITGEGRAFLRQYLHRAHAVVCRRQPHS